MKNRFLSNTSWIVGIRVLQMVISFAVGTCITRYLGPDNYGSLAYTLSFVTFFTSIATLGLNGVAVKFILDDYDEHGSVIGTMVIMQILASFISSICITGLVYYLNKDDKMLIFIAFLQSTSLIFQSFKVFEYWYQSKLQSKVSSIISLIAYVVMSLYKVLLLILGKDLYWFAMATSIDYIVIGILLYNNYRKNDGQMLKFSIKRAKNMFDSSKHYIIAGVMVALYGQMDKVMIGQMLSTQAVGHYAVSVTLCGIWVFVIVAIIDSAKPIIFESKKKNQEIYIKRVRQLYGVVMIISLAVSVMICILAKPIITILYGNQYINSVGALRLVTWNTAFAYTGTITNGIYLMCENKQKYVKYLCLIGVLVNLGFNSTLIPIFGIEGAATATLLTQISTNFIAPMFFEEINEVPYNIIMGVKIIFKTGIKECRKLIVKNHKEN